jgi:ATP:ADP antiporter, AAA family
VQRAHATPAASRLLARAVDVRAGEGAALAWAFAYFFTLLCGYYLLRPIREEMGIRGGVAQLHWVFTATFVVMLAAVPAYSALVARVPRVRAVPLVYRFFLAQLLAFAALLHLAIAPAAVARAFFVWVSVYNLFVVSVFWSFMADVFTSEQGKRLFGFVAAGGSAGALAGPAVAALLVGTIGVAGLVLASAVLLEVSARCAARLGAGGATVASSQERLRQPVGGGALAGITLLFRSRYLLLLALQTLFVTVTSTFVYFQQARIVAEQLRDPAARTRLFAAVDLAVNVLALALQSLATGPILARAGLGVAAHDRGPRGDRRRADAGRARRRAVAPARGALRGRAARARGAVHRRRRRGEVQGEELHRHGRVPRRRRRERMGAGRAGRLRPRCDRGRRAAAHRRVARRGAVARAKAEGAGGPG